MRDSKTPPLSGEITRFSNAFPFTPMGPPHQVYEMIERHLPPYPRACELAESYVTHAAWLFRSVPRTQLFDEMIPHFYKQVAGEDTPLPSGDYGSPHELALLLLCFAIGALVDLKQNPYNSEADHYCQLAQAAMCLRPVLSNPTLVTIQALHLHSIYVAMVGNEQGGQDHNMELSWALVTLAGQLSHTVCMRLNCYSLVADRSSRCQFRSVCVSSLPRCYTFARIPGLCVSSGRPRQCKVRIYTRNCRAETGDLLGPLCRRCVAGRWTRP